MVDSTVENNVTASPMTRIPEPCRDERGEMQACIDAGGQQQGHRSKHQDTGIVGDLVQDDTLGVHPPDFIEGAFDIPRLTPS